MAPINNLWQQMLATLELEIDSSIISTWFRNTQLYETTEDKLIVACTDAYSKSIIQRKYAAKIKEILHQMGHKKLTLEFVVKPSRLTTKLTGPLFTQPPAFDQPPEHTSGSTLPVSPSLQLSTQNLNKHYSLENYVVGVSNRVVHAAAVSVVENPGEFYNPLFVYGSTGVGKTHLLHAIGNAILEKNHHFVVHYAPSEKFVNDLIEHIRQKKPMEKFRKTYRTCDVLLFDDIQFLVGKEASQEEFYHTFNELQQRQCQIVLASDREPGKIEGMADRLISRFKGGLMVQISPPDYETRLAIVRTKAEEFGLELNLTMCQYIAEKTDQNIRELQGVLHQIRLVASNQGNLVSFDLVRSIIDPHATEKSPTKKLTPELILDLIKERFSVSIKDLCGKRRQQEIVVPRQMLMFLLRNELGMNFEDIGEVIGGRDHTTVMHGCERIRQEIEDNQNNLLRSHLNALRQGLYS